MKNCCNHDCNQERDCELRASESATKLEVTFYAAIAVLLVLVLTACQPAKASELLSPMEDADIARQIAATVLLAVDHHQTQEIRQLVEAGAEPWEHREGNPMIRRHFSESGIRNYFTVMAAGSAVITKVLPKEWRPAYQYGVIVLQVVTALCNKKFGLSLAI